MKSRFFVLFICLLATVAIVGCDLFGKDDDDSVLTGSTGTIVGNILNEAGSAIASSLTVTGGNKSVDTTTGAFTLENAAIDGNGKIFLTIKGSGYINTYAVEALNAGQKVVATYTIRAVPAGATQNYTTLNTNAVKAVNIAGRAEIDIATGSIINSTTKAAVSSADITIVHTMPKADSKALDTFPGIFAGIPTGGTTEVPFETFGFVYVDLGDGNELDPSKPATLTMPIDPAMVAAAPATMPLWSYDTTKGQWIQEGTATKIGSNYIAQVTHFSWYNLDRPLGDDVRTLEVTVASYSWSYEDHILEEEGTTNTDKTDLTKRIANARVVVTATLAEGENGAGFSSGDTATWKEVKSTNSNGVVTFNAIPSKRRIAIEVTTQSGATTNGYGYEVENGVAKSFINMGGFQGHGTFNKR
ncbi:MAG TPA: hypothetical protein DCG57_09940 [Candidatus Riflebacteria bacterium]|jgi:hypothetical protein|nr:hypothetical protein [Candidatus Riflebacteria bacterium]